MPRGGKRVGAGRKPGRQKPGGRPAIVGPWAADPSQVATGGASTALEEPPADLPEAQRMLWREYAPQAIAQRTLTSATLGGFRELCEQWALKREIAARIAVLGATTAEADRLLKRYERLAQRLDASLARFKLTAFGKPEGAPTRQASTNPWAAIAGQVG